jgi:hypothetical protein
MAADGLITMPSSYGPKETMERLKAEAAAKGLTTDVGEGVGLKRYDLDPPSTPRAERRLDVLEAYGTNLAL